MADLEITYDVKDFDLAPLFAALEQFTNKTVPEMVKERGGTMARYLAENTQPVAAEGGGSISNADIGQKLDGGSLAARNLGRTAVRRDLGRTYCGPSKVFKDIKEAAGPKLARAFYAAAKKGDVAKAKAIIRKSGIPKPDRDVVPWDGGARHKRLRNKQGRVNRSVEPDVAMDVKAMRAYAKQREDMVGFTKAGWVNAGRQITTRGMSQIRGWIKKHTDAPGSGMDQTHNPDNPRVTLTNAVPWASEALDNKQFFRAEQALTQSMKKELEIILTKLSAKEAARSSSHYGAF